MQEKSAFRDYLSRFLRLCLSENLVSSDTHDGCLVRITEPWSPFHTIPEVSNLECDRVKYYNEYIFIDNCIFFTAEKARKSTVSFQCANIL